MLQSILMKVICTTVVIISYYLVIDALDNNSIQGLEFMFKMHVASPKVESILSFLEFILLLICYMSSWT